MQCLQCLQQIFSILSILFCHRHKTKKKKKIPEGLLCHDCGLRGFSWSTSNSQGGDVLGREFKDVVMGLNLTLW